MGNICCFDQNTIPLQLLYQHKCTHPPHLIISNNQNQLKQQSLDQNGQSEKSEISSPFFQHKQHSNPLKSSRSEQLDHTTIIEQEDSIYPLNTHSMPVVVHHKQSVSGISNNSYKDSISYIQRYKRPITYVHPPSLIQNSVQLSVIGDSYKLNELMSSKLQLWQSCHLMTVLSDGSLVSLRDSNN